MQEVIQSGNIVWVMLAVVVLEAITLIAYWQRTGRGVRPVSLLLNLGAGTSLMLALGATLKGFDWRVTAVLLVVSGVFHLSDVRQRWA
ncbi:MAG: hypothetical protein AAF552_14420 [Pseudomonadota bacterium]